MFPFGSLDFLLSSRGLLAILRKETKGLEVEEGWVQRGVFRGGVSVICGWVRVAFYREVGSFWLAEVGGESKCKNNGG